MGNTLNEIATGAINGATGAQTLGGAFGGAVAGAAESAVGVAKDDVSKATLATLAKVAPQVANDTADLNNAVTAIAESAAAAAAPAGGGLAVTADAVLAPIVIPVIVNTLLALAKHIGADITPELTTIKAHVDAWFKTVIKAV
jgi:NADH dehydrogenase/NADH:ubiquinone oxidoreductase subunit G